LRHLGLGDLDAGRFIGRGLRLWGGRSRDGLACRGSIKGSRFVSRVGTDDGLAASAVRGIRFGGPRLCGGKVPRSLNDGGRR
jgi:hypothetical protein